MDYEELRRLDRERTRGEWRQDRYANDGSNDPMPDILCGDQVVATAMVLRGSYHQHILNSTFIAAAANTIGPLLAERDRLKGLVGECAAHLQHASDGLAFLSSRITPTQMEQVFIDTVNDFLPRLRAELGLTKGEG